MTALQVKEFYEKLANMQNEEKSLRHEMANKLQNITLNMEQKFEKRFDKLETLISEGFDKADGKFATKVEHSYNSNRIEKIEDNISRVVWTILIGVISIVGAAVFVMIMLFGERF